MSEETEFMRAWISQLYYEHANFCWLYGMKLDKPIIEISDSKTYWGSWNPELKTISISSRLIKEYPWEIVLNILKHEMAHQMVTDVYGCNEKHGQLFKEACQRIGLPDEFSGRGGDLPRKITRTSEPDGDSDQVRILEKVRKLLSLARSNNENEALEAMKKANELIAKYNIERLDNDKNSNYTTVIINHRKMRIENYQRRAALILKNFYFVDIVFSRTFDAADCSTYKTIEIIGTTENALMAEYVYYFLLNQLDRLWCHYKTQKNIGGFRNKRSYWLGILKGFADKLKYIEQSNEQLDKHGINENTSDKTMSIIACAEDKGLSIFLNRRHPRLRHYNPGGTTVNGAVYGDGVGDGRNINIHKGICEAQGNQGKLIKAP